MKIDTVEKLAKALKRSKSSVAENWLKHSDWAFSRKAPWDSRLIPKMLAWAAETFSKPTEGGTEAEIKRITNNPEKIARIKVLIAREKKISMETGILGKEYVRREDVDRGSIQKVLAVRAKMQEIPTRAHLLAHKGDAEIARILESWMREVCNYFAGQPSD